MGKRDTKDLERFLAPFDAHTQKTVRWLRTFIWKLYPKCNEIIYDNYNALAIGWSPTGKTSQTFCSIAVGRSSGNIHFGFYWGSKIDDPRGLLLGEGNQYRYLLVADTKSFPKVYAKQLMRKAYAYSKTLVKGDEPPIQGMTITKSVSPVKRKPGKKSRKTGRA